MPGNSFEVTALWDEDAKVWYSESDIIGLHIEASTIEAFRKEVERHAADLIIENHLDPTALETGKLRDLIPTIFWREGKAA
jgi:RNase H-fold protein (predicted Holliday junction resolvase)